MVSIHCPPGYEPGALPLRHSAVDANLWRLKIYTNKKIEISPFTDLNTTYPVSLQQDISDAHEISSSYI